MGTPAAEADLTGRTATIFAWSVVKNFAPSQPLEGDQQHSKSKVQSTSHSKRRGRSEQECCMMRSSSSPGLLCMQTLVHSQAKAPNKKAARAYELALSTPANKGQPHCAVLGNAISVAAGSGSMHELLTR